MKKYRNTKFSSALLFASVVAISSVALAGDVDVIGLNTPVLEVVNSSTGSVHYRAVQGTAIPKGGYGYGGYFSGGYTGVVGKATYSHDGGMRYGVKGEASGGGSGNRGVYGKASGIQSYAGYFNGVVYSTGGYQPSDETLKEEISDLDGSLEQVMELKPKSFRYRTKEHPKKGLPEGYHTGLLAQDVERLYPDLIREVTEDEDPEGQNAKSETFLAINYVELIPVLIGAMQEQQEQIAELQQQVAGCGCR